GGRSEVNEDRPGEGYVREEPPHPARLLARAHNAPPAPAGGEGKARLRAPLQQAKVFKRALLFPYLGLYICATPAPIPPNPLARTMTASRLLAASFLALSLLGSADFAV